MLGLDQRHLSELCGLSIPTIWRMEASSGVIRGNVDSLTKLITALESAGIEFIDENSPSLGGGRGIRLTKAKALHPTHNPFAIEPMHAA
jgi:transcriptional regulator with XRE-family HTH domain